MVRVLLLLVVFVLLVYIGYNPAKVQSDTKAVLRDPPLAPGPAEDPNPPTSTLTPSPSLRQES